MIWSGPVVDARSVRRLELDLEPHRRQADRPLVRLHREKRAEVVRQVVGAEVASRLHRVPIRVRLEWQPEGPREGERRRAARVAVDAALATGEEADRRYARERQRQVRIRGE